MIKRTGSERPHILPPYPAQSTEGVAKNPHPAATRIASPIDSHGFPKPSLPTRPAHAPPPHYADALHQLPEVLRAIEADLKSTMDWSRVRLYWSTPQERAEHAAAASRWLTRVCRRVTRAFLNTRKWGTYRPETRSVELTDDPLEESSAIGNLFHELFHALQHHTYPDFFEAERQRRQRPDNWFARIKKGLEDRYNHHRPNPLCIWIEGHTHLFESRRGHRDRIPYAAQAFDPYAWGAAAYEMLEQHNPRWPQLVFRYPFLADLLFRAETVVRVPRADADRLEADLIKTCLTWNPNALPTSLKID